MPKPNREFVIGLQEQFTSYSKSNLYDFKLLVGIINKDRVLNGLYSVDLTERRKISGYRLETKEEC